MFSYNPANGNGLAFIADARTKDDLEIQGHEGGTPTLERYGMGIASLGQREWQRTARAALFDHREKFPEGRKERKEFLTERKQQLLDWLGKTKPRACIVLQTLSKSVEDSDMLGTTVWDAIRGPGKLSDAQGTAWLHDGCYYVPILNYIQFDYVTRFYIRRWIRMACTLARGTIQPLVCTEKVIHPCQRAADLIAGYQKQPIISIDLESIPSKGIITAINLSDGVTAVSMPWEPYQVYPEGEQVGLSELSYGLDIKRQIKSLIADNSVAKLGHNMAGFDTLELRRKGFELGGDIEDTLLMHRALHPQHRHGLQIACATVLCVPPWKSLFKPVAKSKDSDEFWSASPEQLRDYGADDANMCFQLHNALIKDLA